MDIGISIERSWREREPTLLKKLGFLMFFTRNLEICQIKSNDHVERVFKEDSIIPRIQFYFLAF